MTSHTKPQSLKLSRNRVAPFVVILAGRVIFSADTLSQAFAWRDGHGAGAVYERIIVQGKGVRA